jgi:hypothetical protein
MGAGIIFIVHSHPRSHNRVSEFPTSQALSRTGNDQQAENLFIRWHNENLSNKTSFL